MTAHGDVIPTAGQVWRHAATGTRFTLLGARTRTWVLTEAGKQVTPETTREVPRAALVAEYTYESCDHGDYCCATHDTHVSPHQGCILR